MAQSGGIGDLFMEYCVFKRIYIWRPRSSSTGLSSWRGEFWDGVLAALLDASALSDVSERIINGLWAKRGETGPTMQLFAGFTVDKPVVFG